MAAALGGLDALIFTGGIGENAPDIRERVCRSARWLGIELGREANSNPTSRVSSATSPVSVRVIPTSEELMIAKHTRAILGLVQTQDFDT